MKMEIKRNYLTDTDWFDYQFICGFLYENHSVKEFLNEPQYKIGDEAISSRVLKHWHDTGILEDNRPKGKGWRKFSFTEVVWISIVSQLRNFGLDLKKIKKVKEYLDTFNSTENQSQCPLLDFYIAHCMTSTMPIKLLVFDTGEALIGRQVAIDLAVQYGFIKDDYISIDIAKLINKRFKGKKIETDYSNYSLSTIEKEVQQGIYYDDVKSITINVNGNKDILLTKEHIKNSRDEIKVLLQKTGEYYEESSVRTGKGKHYKLVEKKKLKK
jgi:DNA-binding transcriptional MerR regulator